MVTVRMMANLNVQVGTRLFYDCPAMSPEDYKSDIFFKKYRGHEATVVELSVEQVLPLDRKGRQPGVYYDGGLKVQFDGEDEVRELNLNHFLVLGPAEVVTNKVPNFVSDLPEDPSFYPFDTVLKENDLLATPRLVVSIGFNREGVQVCNLADTDDMTQAKKRKDQSNREKARQEGNWFPLGSMTMLESVVASELQLLKRGNAYQLYHNPTSMSFSSSEEELAFWAIDGLSRQVFVGSKWDFELAQARGLLDLGQADLIVESIRSSTDKPVCKVRVLHDLFHSFRDRVRSLAAENIVTYSAERNDPFTGLAEMIFRP